MTEHNEARKGEQGKLARHQSHISHITGPPPTNVGDTRQDTTTRYHRYRLSICQTHTACGKGHYATQRQQLNKTPCGLVDKDERYTMSQSAGQGVAIPQSESVPELGTSCGTQTTRQTQSQQQGFPDRKTYNMGQGTPCSTRQLASAHTYTM